MCEIESERSIMERERGEKRKKRRDREIEPRMREMKLRPGGGRGIKWPMI